MGSSHHAYSIYYEPDLDLVVMEWDGYATSARFREGTELMLKLLRDHGCSRVLADIKDMVLIGTEDQAWLNNDFLPRAIAAGFRAIALIRPDSYFNKVAVESVSYKVDRSALAIGFFDNTAAAKEWLTHFPAKPREA